MIVHMTLDLSRYDTEQLAKLVVQGVLTQNEMLAELTSRGESYSTAMALVSRARQRKDVLDSKGITVTGRE